MRDLVTVDLAKVTQKVSSVLPDFGSVAGAYLFGSSLGLCRPDSDFDLALIVDPPLQGMEVLALESQIEMALGILDGHPFSILLLANPGYFAWKAVRSGQLVYEKDPVIVTDFLEQVALAHDLDEHALGIFHAEADHLAPRELVSLERIQEKLRFIQEQVALIQKEAPIADREALVGYLADKVNLAAVKYLLQTNIQAIIDIAYHLCAKACHKAPESALDALTVLANDGFISKEDLPWLMPLIGFRNRVVHGYETADPDFLLNILQNQLDVFRKWESLVAKIVAALPPPK